MSTQVKFGDCLSWQSPRPSLVPAFFGKLTEDVRPLCAGARGEASRRADQLPQSYGHGVPTLNTAHTDLYGIGLGSAREHQIASTLEGSVKLPLDFQETSYTPSIDTLDFLTHTVDTRLQAKPLRYFR